jgi:transcriptional regulator with XRE-family HTH domain
MTQDELGERIGVRCQQIQKYETGANRVSASRLWNIAAAQLAPISYYFDEEPTTLNGVTDGLLDKEGTEFLRMISFLSADQRTKLLALINTMGGE